MMQPNWLSARWHRFKGWFIRQWCHLRGRHVLSPYDWGYAGGGMVDCYCPNCLKVVKRMPLEDFETMGDVLATVEAARRGML